MVKYFSILASLDDEIVLQRVKELEKDKAFVKEVPNLVRALYGSFARNLKHFHAKDGSGYRFIGEKIQEIDAINPQMAAALAGSFKLYKKIAKENQVHMESTLQSLVDCEKISKNCYEIVNKTLH
jgi:aminopeptidase N